jgi:molybdopterin-guanine dinucleotide biosynthesis protein A
MVDLTQITLAVLAGGEGSRMGFPKSQLRVGGEPILEFLLKRFDWPAPTLLITAPGREHPAGCELFDKEAVDAVANQGPLRGVLTALEHATTNTSIVVTVDMPGLTADHLRWVVEKLIAKPQLMGMMMRRTFNGKPQIEPFPFFCRKSAATIIADRLTEGRRSLHSLADLPGFAVEDAPSDWPEKVWTNLNRPEDLRKLPLF